MTRMVLRAIFATAFLALEAFEGAHAQTWPTRPVTMVVPYAAGGPVDTMGRIMAARLSELLRQQVIIENVGGAGGKTRAAPGREKSPRRSPRPPSGTAALAIYPTPSTKPLFASV